MPNPRGQYPPLNDADIHEIDETSSCNLVESLGGCVDDIRQIATDLGARPHTYHSIKVQWSGGELGRGEPEVISETAILPTPRTETSGIDRKLEAGGIAERGDVTLTGISPRFTEDEIDELFGATVEAGFEVFIEQRIDLRDGVTRRRRFVLAPRAPERRPTRTDWKVFLRKADGNRLRDGQVRKAREQVW